MLFLKLTKYIHLQLTHIVILFPLITYLITIIRFLDSDFVESAIHMKQINIITLK